MINEEVSRQVIAMVERGNIRTAKMVIELMKKMLNMAAKKGKSLKEFIKEKKPTTVKDHHAECKACHESCLTCIKECEKIAA